MLLTQTCLITGGRKKKRRNKKEQDTSLYTHLQASFLLFFLSFSLFFFLSTSLSHTYTHIDSNANALWAVHSAHIVQMGEEAEDVSCCHQQIWVTACWKKIERKRRDGSIACSLCVCVCVSSTRALNLALFFFRSSQVTKTQMDPTRDKNKNSRG